MKKVDYFLFQLIEPINKCFRTRCQMHSLALLMFYQFTTHAVLGSL